jgi:diguanylate cyclase (GGDEF)-like protein
MLRRASEQHVALVLFDLDNFKQINDQEGHPEGDRVLRDVSRIALRQLRVGEELFRIGGEEFAIVVLCDEAGGGAVAERVRNAVEEQRRARLPTLSAGVAAFNGNGDTKDDLVQRADMGPLRSQADRQEPSRISRPRELARAGGYHFERRPRRLV